MRNIQLLIFSTIALLLWGFRLYIHELPPLPKALKDHFIPIQEGLYLIDTDTLQGTSFYLEAHEVSNAEYLRFTESMRGQLTEEEYQKIVPDTSVWLTPKKRIEPYVNYYFRHSAYARFPVVGIDLNRALAYCKWLQDSLNQYYGPSITLEVTLPTRKEWVQAAQAGNLTAAYSWGNDYLRRIDKKYRGNSCAQYQYLQNNCWKRTDSTFLYDASLDQISSKQDHGITAPVQSFWPSSIGLYHMNGNVAELTLDSTACGGSWTSTGYDIRNQSYQPFTRPTFDIGFRPVIKIHHK